MNRDYSQFQHLSPFEIKDELIRTATQKFGAKHLNAGRGNPNFITTLPREAFFQLGLFSLKESERFLNYIPNLGGLPEKSGIDIRFDDFVNSNPKNEGVQFLRKMMTYIHEKMGIDKVDILEEFVNGILGDNYPVPPRMLKYSEKIAAKYILQEMGSADSSETIDIFATEGGTAAMSYIFQTLSKNGIIKKGDKIALGMPIFVPYIEIPHLSEYELVQIPVYSAHGDSWQYHPDSVDQLLDPEIKAFFVVNPTNPASVKIQDSVLERIATIVEKRPDLILLTDDVYATFANNFKSLFAICPKNTILVYSYSKYFGATGWRLGLIVMHKENNLDKLLHSFPEEDLKKLDQRYESLLVEPRKMKLIDRFVADSRSVGLNHTSGISTPQQIQLTLFSLFEMMDEEKHYKSAMKRLKHERYLALYEGINTIAPHNDNDVHYYHIIPMGFLSGNIFGQDFGNWLNQNKTIIEILFDLAEKGVVLLPADGFGVKEPLAVRVSLANLTASEYCTIGKVIRSLLEEYYSTYQKQ